MKLKDFYTTQGWCKNAHARTADGGICGIGSAEARMFCMLGAIMKIGKAEGNNSALPESEHYKLKMFLAETGWRNGVAAWNDDPSTTFEEVKAVLEYLDI